jgi:hypothetical protein
MLPLGAAIDNFKVPNLYVHHLAALKIFIANFQSLMTRFFYNNEGKWVLGYDLIFNPPLSCDPYKLQDAAKKYHIPKNDIIGAFFYQRREMIETFCRRLSSLKLDFSMSCFDARFLDQFVPQDPFLTAPRNASAVLMSPTSPIWAILN